MCDVKLSLKVFQVRSEQEIFGGREITRYINFNFLLILDTYSDAINILCSTESFCFMSPQTLH